MNETQYTIEKDVAIPPKRTRTITSPLSHALRAMEVGDSIVLDQRGRNSAFAIAQGLKIKLASRRINPNSEEIRVWRVA